MGYKAEALRVVVSLSNHNSEKDKEHEELWKDLIKRVEEIVEDPKYSPIQAMVF